MRVLIAVLVLLVPTLVQAQVPANTAFNVQFDHDGLYTTGFDCLTDGKTVQSLPITGRVCAIPGLAAGTHTVEVVAKGNTPAKSAPLTVTAGTVPAPSPLVISSITSNVPSPQPTGTAITFTALATGGTTPYQFKWWVYDDATGWKVVQEWGASASFAWTPTVAKAYVIQAGVRNAGVTGDVAGAALTMNYSITAVTTPPPATPTNLRIVVQVAIQSNGTVTITSSSVEKLP